MSFRDDDSLTLNRIYIELMEDFKILTGKNKKKYDRKDTTDTSTAKEINKR